MNRVKKIIEETGTNDPYVIAECLGVIVRTDPLGKVQGYYIRAYGMDAVVINSELSEPLKRFILAHEIGHIILHPYSTVFAMRHTLLVTDKQELEADRFAINLLLTDEMLQTNPHYTIDQWASVLGLPREIVELRFEEVLL